MGGLFLETLRMSIAASWLILAVILLRAVLKKTPKWMVVLWWGIAALRLTLPFSIESAWSLLPSGGTFNAYSIPYDTPAIHNAVNPVLGGTFTPNPAGSVNPPYVWTSILPVVWCIGIAVMLLYAVISYARVRRSVSERVPYEGNIFLCDHVKSPFILGLVRPKIYLPSSMDAMVMDPVIAHEKAHLARRDHWWKPLGFLILTVHWFNPLCWTAYVLLCRDIELACDEKVIRQMDLVGKKQYSAALLACSTGRRLVIICPLAFGEVDVKERVKNVLHYKKPAFWIIAGAVAACAVVTVCFATNPKRSRPHLAAPGAAAATFFEEQTAIQKSILGHNRRPETPTDILSCCSFVTLDTVLEPPKAGNDVGRATYYGWALYEEYQITDSGLETVRGSHIPVALTFEYDDYGYSLLEYWEPRDGGYYLQDIRKKFPAHIVEDSLDSQKFILQQTQECYAQAIASTGLDTDKVIGPLIETICSGPALSSNPGDYIEAHPIEYRELTYYGRYTLQYCFARFEAGGETGLAGHIMQQACEDIAAGWGEKPLVSSQLMSGALTGQMWYSAFKSNALRLLEQYREMALAERYPASYQLLSMLGEA